MTINNLLKNGIGKGMQYLFPLVGTFILYLLTIWIPYINIGTTIALFALPAMMSRGESISPAQIFDSKYRKKMGNFFMLITLMLLTIYLGIALLCVPYFFIGSALAYENPYVFEEVIGYILVGVAVIIYFVFYYSWFLAILLQIDTETTPIKALHDSNEKTYGHKLTMFFSHFFLGIGFGLIFYCLYLLAMEANSQALAIVLLILWVIIYLIYICLHCGIQSEVYRQLVGGESKK